MKNTPLQKLIEKFGNAQNMKSKNVIHLTLHYDKLIELLKEEKQMVVDAYVEGVADSDNDYFNEQYFNEKFEQ